MANGNVPTGYAPLYLGDLSSRQNAIAQNLTEHFASQMQRKQKEDDVSKAKSQAAILEALDFEAIEGLSEQVTKEHLDLVNSVSDKWTKIMYERGNKLSPEDYMMLNRDKKRVEQEIAGKKHNVAQAAYIQKQLTTNPDLYEPGAAQKFAEFVERGDLGRSTDGILTPYFNMWNAMEEGVDLTGMASSTDVRYDRPKEGAEWTTAHYDNERFVRNKAEEFLKNNPVAKYQTQRPEVKEHMLAQAEAWIRSKIHKTKKEVRYRPNQDADGKGAGTMANTVKGISDRGQKFFNYDQELWGQIKADPRLDVFDISKTKDGGIEVIYNKIDPSTKEKTIQVFDPFNLADPSRLAENITRAKDLFMPADIAESKFLKAGWEQYIGDYLKPQDEFKVDKPAEVPLFAQTREVLKKPRAEYTKDDWTNLVNAIGYLTDKKAQKKWRHWNDWTTVLEIDGTKYDLNTIDGKQKIWDMANQAIGEKEYENIGDMAEFDKYAKEIRADDPDATDEDIRKFMEFDKNNK